MNKELLKNLLILTVGVGIGAFGAIVLTKEKYEQIVQEELASIREEAGVVSRQKERLNARYGKHPTEDYNANGNEENVISITKDQYKKIATQYGMDEQAASKDKNDIIDYADVAYRIDARDPADPPYVIDLESFSEDGNFDKVTLYFYEDDEVLTEENEEVITDVDSIVGDEALACFGDGSEDPEVVYVRNERLSIDYEVIRLSKSYARTILGMDTDGDYKPVRRYSDDN